MHVAYSGISGRIGHFINQYRSTTSYVLDRSVFNWEDPDTYRSLTPYDRLFLSFPVNKINILNLLPRFLSTINSSQTIVKFGSLGPQRVIHDLIDRELRQKCQVISLQLAPTMQNIIDEQICSRQLLDYRCGRPAPYVAAEDAANLAVRAVEHTVTKNTLAVTGPENLTLQQVRNILANHQWYDINTISADVFCEQYKLYDTAILSQITQLYSQYECWNPVPSTDLEDNGITPLNFKQWVDNNHTHLSLILRNSND